MFNPDIGRQAARFCCECGGVVQAFLTGSVNRELVALMPKDEVSP